MPTTGPDSRDWKKAGEECLVAALDRARVLAPEATSLKDLDSLIKTVGEVVGVGTVLNRRGTATAEDDTDEQD